MSVLHCHSQGDKRFSAFYAYVDFLGMRDTIEKFYQLSKRIESFAPSTIMEGKGKKPTHFCVRGITFDASYALLFYQTLWVMYFRQNPDLYEYARQFDDFHDRFKGKSKINQENTIRRIVRIGLDEASKECVPFVLYLKRQVNK